LVSWFGCGRQAALWLNISILTVPASGDGPPAAGGPPLRTVHLFRDVTATKELLTLVHERLAAPEPPGAAGAPALTRREVEVLRLMAAGASTKATAETLHVSRATVRNHVQNIFSKLDVHNRLEAVAHARRHRLL
jgi:DNA-binding NarL/FixJ family response regulator